MLTEDFEKGVLFALELLKEQRHNAEEEIGVRMQGASSLVGSQLHTLRQTVNAVEVAFETELMKRLSEMRRKKPNRDHVVPSKKE